MNPLLRLLHLTRRSFAGHKKLAALLLASVLLSVVFISALVQAWKVQTAEPLTCQARLGPLLPGNNGYIELQLKQQHPVEPYFEGGVFINLADKYGTEPKRLTVVRSAERSYYRSEVVADLFYDTQNKVLWMKDMVPLDFVPEKGSHIYFPFDSASFDFELSINPAVDLRVVQIRNRVPGFVMDCNTGKVTRTADGAFNIRFHLSRNPLVQLTAAVLCMASTLFLLLIVRLEKIESLATSVASFFFSLWSVRAILSSEIKVFPTLLDCWILTLCALMLFLLGWKVVLTKMVRSEPTLPPRIDKGQR